SASISRSTWDRRSAARNFIVTFWIQRMVLLLSLRDRLDDTGDGRRQPRPVRGLQAKLAASGSGERVELGRTSRVRLLPCAADPALVLQLVKGRIERSVAYLQCLVRHLAQALRDGPARSG